MVLVIGFVYALPNLYPTQPSIQVAYTDSGKSADQELLTELKDILHKSAKEEIQNDSAYINADQETKMRMVIENAYDEIFLRDNKIVIKQIIKRGAEETGLIDKAPKNVKNLESSKRWGTRDISLLILRESVLLVKNGEQASRRRSNNYLVLKRGKNYEFKFL